ncbi:MAG: hypothetical protein WAM60_02195 [Candidatus Promineifilaceae bacterium]
MPTVYKLTDKIKAQVRGGCRVTLDEVAFITPDTIAADAPGKIDRRNWH